MQSNDQQTSEVPNNTPPLSMPIPQSRPPSFRTTEGSLAPRPGQPETHPDEEHIIETAGDDEEYDINGNVVPRR